MALSRRILIRVVGAPLLVAALCAVIYWGHRLGQEHRPNLPVRFLVLGVALVSGHEIFAMCAVRGIVTARAAGLLALGAVFLPWEELGAGPFLASGEAVAAGLPLYLGVALVFRYGRLSPEGAGLTYLAVGYLALLRYALDLPAPLAAGQAYYLLFLLAAGKGSDMAAFVAGKTFGRHPMAPVVSPHKTWEGGVAGAVVGTAAGFAVLRLTPISGAYAGLPTAALLFFCLIVTIASQVGDLVKSALKRWAGVKDSGRLLPEFGGMLDMADSFILAAPVATLGTRLLGRIFLPRLF